MDDWNRRIRVLVEQISAVDPNYEQPDTSAKICGVISYADIAAGRKSPCSRDNSPGLEDNLSSMTPLKSLDSGSKDRKTTEVRVRTKQNERQQSKSDKSEREGRKGRSPTKKSKPKETTIEVPIVKVEHDNKSVASVSQKLDIESKLAPLVTKRTRSPSPLWIPGSTSYADILRGRMQSSSRASSEAPSEADDGQSMVSLNSTVVNKPKQIPLYDDSISKSPEVPDKIESLQGLIPAHSLAEKDNWSSQSAPPYQISSTAEFGSISNVSDYTYINQMPELVGYISSQLTTYPGTPYVYTPESHQPLEAMNLADYNNYSQTEILSANPAIYQQSQQVISPQCQISSEPKPVLPDQPQIFTGDGIATVDFSTKKTVNPVVPELGIEDEKKDSLFSYAQILSQGLLASKPEQLRMQEVDIVSDQDIRSEEPNVDNVNTKTKTNASEKKQSSQKSNSVKSKKQNSDNQKKDGEKRVIEQQKSKDSNHGKSNDKQKIEGKRVDEQQKIKDNNQGKSVNQKKDDGKPVNEKQKSKDITEKSDNRSLKVEKPVIKQDVSVEKKVDEQTKKAKNDKKRNSNDKLEKMEEIKKPIEEKNPEIEEKKRKQKKKKAENSKDDEIDRALKEIENMDMNKQKTKSKDKEKPKEQTTKSNERKQNTKDQTTTSKAAETENKVSDLNVVDSVTQQSSPVTSIESPSNIENNDTEKSDKKSKKNKKQKKNTNLKNDNNEQKLQDEKTQPIPFKTETVEKEEKKLVRETSKKSQEGINIQLEIKEISKNKEDTKQIQKDGKQDCKVNMVESLVTAKNADKPRSKKANKKKQADEKFVASEESCQTQELEHKIEPVIEQIHTENQQATNVKQNKLEIKMGESSDSGTETADKKQQDANVEKNKSVENKQSQQKKQKQKQLNSENFKTDVSVSKTEGKPIGNVPEKLKSKSPDYESEQKAENIIKDKQKNLIVNVDIKSEVTKDEKLKSQIAETESKENELSSCKKLAKESISAVALSKDNTTMTQSSKKATKKGNNKKKEIKESTQDDKEKTQDSKSVSMQNETKQIVELSPISPIEQTTGGNKSIKSTTRIDKVDEEHPKEVKSVSKKEEDPHDKKSVKQSDGVETKLKEEIGDIKLLKETAKNDTVSSQDFTTAEPNKDNLQEKDIEPQKPDEKPSVTIPNEPTRQSKKAKRKQKQEQKEEISKGESVPIECSKEVNTSNPNETSIMMIAEIDPSQTTETSQIDDKKEENVSDEKIEKKESKKSNKKKGAKSSGSESTPSVGNKKVKDVFKQAKTKDVSIDPEVQTVEQPIVTSVEDFTKSPPHQPKQFIVTTKSEEILSLRPAPVEAKVTSTYTKIGQEDMENIKTAMKKSQNLSENGANLTEEPIFGSVQERKKKTSNKKILKTEKESQSDLAPGKPKSGNETKMLISLGSSSSKSIDSENDETETNDLERNQQCLDELIKPYWLNYHEYQNAEVEFHKRFKTIQITEQPNKSSSSEPKKSINIEEAVKAAIMRNPEEKSLCSSDARESTKSIPILDDKVLKNSLPELNTAELEWGQKKQAEVSAKQSASKVNDGEKKKENKKTDIEKTKKNSDQTKSKNDREVPETKNVTTKDKTLPVTKNKTEHAKEIKATIDELTLPIEADEKSKGPLTASVEKSPSTDPVENIVKMNDDKNDKKSKKNKGRQSKNGSAAALNSVTVAEAATEHKSATIVAKPENQQDNTQKKDVQPSKKEIPAKDSATDELKQNIKDKSKTSAPQTDVPKIIDSSSNLQVTLKNTRSRSRSRSTSSRRSTSNHRKETPVSNVKDVQKTVLNTTSDSSDSKSSSENSHKKNKKGKGKKVSESNSQNLNVAKNKLEEKNDKSDNKEPVGSTTATQKEKEVQEKARSSEVTEETKEEANKSEPPVTKEGSKLAEDKSDQSQKSKKKTKNKGKQPEAAKLVESNKPNTNAPISQTVKTVIVPTEENQKSNVSSEPENHPKDVIDSLPQKSIEPRKEMSQITKHQTPMSEKHDSNVETDKGKTKSEKDNVVKIIPPVMKQEDNVSTSVSNKQTPTVLMNEKVSLEEDAKPSSECHLKKSAKIYDLQEKEEDNGKQATPSEKPEAKQPEEKKPVSQPCDNKTTASIEPKAYEPEQTRFKLVEAVIPLLEETFTEEPEPTKQELLESVKPLQQISKEEQNAQQSTSADPETLKNVEQSSETQLLVTPNTSKQENLLNPSEPKSRPLSRTPSADFAKVKFYIDDEVVRVSKPKSVKTLPLDQATWCEYVSQDTGFWHTKKLYDDAERDFVLALTSRKQKPAAQSITDQHSKPDDGSDRGSSGGGDGGNRGSRADPGSRSGDPRTERLVADLPGGICSWSDFSTYLSLKNNDEAKFDGFPNKSGSYTPYPESSLNPLPDPILVSQINLGDETQFNQWSSLEEVERDDAENVDTQKLQVRPESLDQNRFI